MFQGESFIQSSLLARRASLRRLWGFVRLTLWVIAQKEVRRNSEAPFCDPVQRDEDRRLDEMAPPRRPVAPGQHKHVQNVSHVREA